jgi:AmmeMemoRadiSam system protein A
MPLPEPQARRLLDIARASILYGLQRDEPLPIDTEREAPDLLEIRATFVTLHLRGQLRGCIGTIEAHRSLAEDVAANAYAAAFEDPRFSRVTPAEADQLTLHISILTPPVPLPCRNEKDLLGKLRPGRDGLILQESPRRATFLPSVWEEVPDPLHFLGHLKRKAGLPADYWSKTLRFWRYEAESIPQA